MGAFFDDTPPSVHAIPTRINSDENLAPKIDTEVCAKDTVIISRILISHSDTCVVAGQALS